MSFAFATCFDNVNVVVEPLGVKSSLTIDAKPAVGCLPIKASIISYVICITPRTASIADPVPLSLSISPVSKIYF